MASYKVIQEVEAEDKIIGPFALKHIIYGMIATGIGVAGWFMGGKTSYWLAIPLLSPFFLITAFVCLSALLRLNQPADVWLFSRMNFTFRPKKRLWQQIGGTYRPFMITEKTAVTAAGPASRTDSEVETMARDLSSILDSRGRSIRGETMQPAVAAHADALDKEHDDYHLDLNRHYHRLLSEHRDMRKKGVDYHLKRTLRAQHNLQPSPTASPGQSFKTQPSNHLSAKISEMTESGDLKVSTLEKMVKNLKSKEKLKRNKKRS
ncbi:PrgI family protein [Candidatus Saccharibacteria bacterium]|nr:PrgI family protein [Candidatus Saccharibacteria bacterium]